jgi:hypothetical protein
MEDEVEMIREKTVRDEFYGSVGLLFFDDVLVESFKIIRISEDDLFFKSSVVYVIVIVFQKLES